MTDVCEPGAATPPRIVLLATVGAALGGLLFGYDAAVISGALLLLEQDFVLSNLDKVSRLGRVLGQLHTWHGACTEMGPTTSTGSSRLSYHAGARGESDACWGHERVAFR